MTTAERAADGSPTGRPTLRVISGSPSAEELAVITALLAAAGGEPEPSPAPIRSRWADPATRMRRPLRSGPGAWVAAGRRR